MTTLAEALAQAAELLASADAGDADREAAILLTHVLGKPRSHLYAWPEAGLDPAQEAAFLELVRRRAAGEPVAYLTGRREFWSLELEVTADTLIPRPETELLVEQTLALLPADRPLRIADLGTGSGAIAIALASERPDWQLLAVDRSHAALRVAARNARRQQANRLLLVQGRWSESIAPDSLDALIANPPYVAEDDPHLLRGDLRFEPRAALAAGPEGLDDLQSLVADAPRVLRTGAAILLEHGADQAKSVRFLLKNKGFTDIHTECDLAGLERVTRARAGS